MMIAIKLRYSFYSKIDPQFKPEIRYPKNIKNNFKIPKTVGPCLNDLNVKYKKN
jgi:hypothetical protein